MPGKMIITIISSGNILYLKKNVLDDENHLSFCINSKL